MSGGKKLSKIASGSKRKASAELEAPLYNEMVDFADALDRDMSYFVRVSLKMFADKYREQLSDDPIQLSLDLSHV